MNTIRLHNFLIACFALAVFLFFWNQMHISISWKQMFSTSDAQSYWEMHYFFNKGSRSFGLENRPFIYPIFQWLTISLGGIYALWLAQVGLWFGSILLTFNTLRNHTKSLFISYLGALVLLLNFSLINLTFHGLTEVATVFILILLVRHLIKATATLWEIKTNSKLLFFLALLTCIKPVFEIPLLACCVLVVLVQFKKIIRQPKLVTYPLFALLPFFIQLSISKVAYGEWRVSNISHITWRDYLYTQGIQEQQQISLTAARSIARKNESHMRKELLKDKKFYWKLFRQNYRGNINALPELLKYNNSNYAPVIYKFMVAYNKHSVFVHDLFCLIFYLLCVVNLRRIYKPDFLVPVFLFVLVWYYLMATGISFSQGDRLVIGALGVWPILYSLLLFMLIKSAKDLFQKLKR